MWILLLLEKLQISYNSVDFFPPVTNMAIVTYLALTTSYYTKEQMKAYISLNGFKFFETGFLTKCGATNIHDHYIVVTGNVSALM